VLKTLRFLDRFAARFVRPTGKRFGRPSLLSDTHEWVRLHQPEGAALQLSYPAEVAENAPPKTLQGLADREYSLLAKVGVPAAYLLEIPRGRVVGEHGAIVTPDNNLLLDVSWPIGSLHSYLAGTNDIPDGEEFYVDAALPIRHIAGSVAVLSAFYGRSYFHWVFDVLPRLGILEHVGMDLNDVDFFVVPGYFAGFQIETLTELGIRRDRVISSLKHRHIRADRLLVPSLPRRTGVVPSWVVDYLRSAFPPTPPPNAEAPTRLFITRKVTDHGLLDGEDQLVSKLRKYGFTPVAMENFTLGEKHWLLSNAEAVMGPSGAGLANVVFCNPGTKVIELRVQPIPLLESWDIANRCGLDFYDVLPSGYGETDVPVATDPWGLAFRASIAESDIFAALEMAGLGDVAPDSDRSVLS
jgi:capsular polysaccharide biosynthesis protein